MCGLILKKIPNINLYFDQQYPIHIGMKMFHKDLTGDFSIFVKPEGDPTVTGKGYF